MEFWHVLILNVCSFEFSKNCSQIFWSYTQIISSHLLSAFKFDDETSPSDYICEYGKEDLGDSSSLADHVVAAHEIPPTINPPTVTPTERSTAKRAHLDSSSGGHTCHLCSRTFKTKMWFVAHMMSQHSIRLPGLNIYRCDKCDNKVCVGLACLFRWNNVGM